MRRRIDPIRCQKVRHRKDWVWGVGCKVWRFLKPSEWWLWFWLAAFLVCALVAYWGVPRHLAPLVAWMGVAACAMCFANVVVHVAKQVRSMFQRLRIPKSKRLWDECGHVVDQVSYTLGEIASQENLSLLQRWRCNDRKCHPIADVEKAWVIKQYVELEPPIMWGSRAIMAEVLKGVMAVISGIQAGGLLSKVIGNDQLDFVKEISNIRVDVSSENWTVVVPPLLILFELIYVVVFCYRAYEWWRRYKRFILTTAMRLLCERELGGVDRRGAISK